MGEHDRAIEEAARKGRVAWVLERSGKAGPLDDLTILFAAIGNLLIGFVLDTVAIALFVPRAIASIFRKRKTAPRSGGAVQGGSDGKR